MKSKTNSSVDNQNSNHKVKSFGFSNTTIKGKSYKFLFIFIIILISSFMIYKNYNEINIQPEVEKTSQTEDTPRLVCDRTTRLENDANIDRALSLIYERLTQYGTDKKLFPPQLVNCIKVEVENIKNETEVEGYFDESNEDIKSNYFPIVIDDWGNFFADDLSTALLLVHEITHVQQYIDRYNISASPTTSEIFNTLSEMSKSRCLDNEVFAYKSQLLFTIKLNNEEKKSINYRILSDDDLIPQLQILKSLKESFTDFSFASSCEEKYDTDCINRKIHTKIYDLLRDGGAYNEQCSVYEGTFIGE